MTAEEYIRKIEDLKTAENIEQAMSVCEEALSKFPEEAKLYYIKALLLLNQESPFDSELFSNLLKKATDLAPNWAEPHKLWAYVAAQQGQPDLALRGYGRALAVDPQDDDTWYQQAQVKHSLSDFAGAVEDATKAIELSADHVREIYYAQRACAKRALQDYEGALADYQKAVEINPNYGGGFLDMAQIKFTQQDFQGAIDLISHTIQLFPQYAPAYGMRGEAKIQLNDLKGALQDFQQALFLDPKDERPLPRIAELQNQLLAQIPEGTQALHVTLKTGHKAMQIPLDGELVTFLEFPQEEQPNATNTSSSAPTEEEMKQLQSKFMNLCRWGTVKEVEELLSRGVDVNESHLGTTPLKNAILGNKPQTVALLLEHGAKVTSYEIALAENHHNEEIINLLKSAENKD